MIHTSGVKVIAWKMEGNPEIWGEYISRLWRYDDWEGACKLADVASPGCHDTHVLPEWAAHRDVDLAILLKTSADNNKVKTTLSHQVIGYLTGMDHTDSTHQQLITHGRLDSLCEWHLKARASVDLLCRVTTARANIEHINASLIRQCLSHPHGVFELPALSLWWLFLQPVSSTGAQHNWHGIRNVSAGKLRNFK